MTDEASAPASKGVDLRAGAQATAHHVPRLELTDAAAELLAIVAYVSANDGPLQPSPESQSLSPWHEPLLAKARERLEIIDASLRARVAFLVGGKDRGYGMFEAELPVAQAALDACRATTVIVESLLEGRPPRVWQFDLMGDTSLQLFAALGTE